MNTPRHLIPSNGPDPQPIRAALSLAADLDKGTVGGLPVTLLTPANSTLGSGTVLTQVVGQPAAKALLRGEFVNLSRDIKLRHDSQKTLSQYKEYGVIVAVYPSRKILNQLDSLDSVAAIIVVPWMMDDVTEWIATWGPTIPGRATASAVRTVRNLFVEVALENLTGSINLSTGLGHPLDKAKAVGLFRSLNKLREAYDPDEIRAWAIQHNWSPASADELKRIGEAIRDGKRIRAEPGYEWSKEYIEHLRAEVSKREVEGVR